MGQLPNAFTPSLSSWSCRMSTPLKGTCEGTDVLLVGTCAQTHPIAHRTDVFLVGTCAQTHPIDHRTDVLLVGTCAQTHPIAHRTRSHDNAYKHTSSHTFLSGSVLTHPIAHRKMCFSWVRAHKHTPLLIAHVHTIMRTNTPHHTRSFQGVYTHTTSHTSTQECVQTHLFA